MDGSSEGALHRQRPNRSSAQPYGKSRSRGRPLQVPSSSGNRIQRSRLPPDLLQSSAFSRGPECHRLCFHLYPLRWLSFLSFHDLHSIRLPLPPCFSPPALGDEPQSMRQPNSKAGRPYSDGAYPGGDAPQTQVPRSRKDRPPDS